MTVSLTHHRAVRCTRRSGAGGLLLLMLAALTSANLITAPAAQAHAVLRSTSPAAGATVANAPAEVVLTFDEPPLSVGSVVRVIGPGGRVASVGAVRIIGDAVHQTLASGLGGGTYRVDWRVTSDDGHPVSDEFSFALAAPAAGISARRAATPATTPTSTPTNTAPTTAAGQPQGDRDKGSGPGTPWPVLLIAVLVLLAVAAMAVPRTRALVIRRRS